MSPDGSSSVLHSLKRFRSETGGGIVSNSAAHAPVKRDSLCASVLVLNRNYMAVHICSAKRAVDLLYKDSAEALFVTTDSFTSHDWRDWVRLSQESSRFSRAAERPEQLDWVRTVSMQFLVPRVIRLLRYEKLPRWEVKFNRRNIFLRDQHTCQYCSRKLTVSQLTLDHVTPKSRGGKTTWVNVVSSCIRCNIRKGNQLPQEANMKLLNQPVKPKISALFQDHRFGLRYDTWKGFL